MIRAFASILFGILPVAGLASPGEITPMARYCVEALVDSRPLITSAMLGTTAEAVGRGDADERVEFFTVPHEDLVFSRLNVEGLSACTVFVKPEAEGWSEASVIGHLQALGMIPAPDCDSADQAVWFSTLPNLKRHGVTAVMNVADGRVDEILAYETPELTRPSDCVAGATE